MATAEQRGRDKPAIHRLPIASIARDPAMQHRLNPKPEIVEEYRAAIRAGDEFPPVRVWWDGERYWPSDGFSRLAAADLEGVTDFLADVHTGAREDALWDSYGANSTHGSRRSPKETESVIQLALRHPNSAQLSNVEIAKHLHVSEITVRRWRVKLSSTCVDDRLRSVTRKGTTYTLHCGVALGAARRRRAKTRRDLLADLAGIKSTASPAARRLLAIVEHWVRGSSTLEDFQRAAERFLGEQHPASCEASAPTVPSVD